MKLNERIQQFRERLAKFWTRMNSRTKRLLLLALAVLAVVAGVLIYREATRPFAVLFSDLSSDDMTSILNYLEANNISDYRVQNNDRILVPANQEAQIRAQILTGGYVASGTNYNLYLDNVNALSSDADRRALQIYDLQNRLAATIKYFPGVRDAWVYITLGSDSRYILSSDSVTTASASVTVQMRNGQTLSTQHASAIRNMVKNAVAGLEIDNVSINDTDGNLYNSDDSSSTSDAAQLKLSLESRVNAYVKSQILNVLEPMFGVGNVAVTVNSTVDISRRYEESTLYDEPEWSIEAANGQGIIGRRIWGNAISRDAGTGAGGVAGTTTNADLNEYVVDQSQLNGTENEISTSGEVDYQVPTTRIQTETPAGTITDMSVAVSINSERVDVPNIDTLVAQVARAAGIQAEVQNDKISVMAYPFYIAPPEPTTEETLEVLGVKLPAWIKFALVAGLIVFALLALIIFLVRRWYLKRKARIQAERERQRIIDEANAMAAAAEAAAAEAAAAGDSEAAERALQAARDALAAAEAAANGDPDAAKAALGNARGTLSTARGALVAAAAEAALAGDMEAAKNALDAFKKGGGATIDTFASGGVIQTGPDGMPVFVGPGGEIPEGEEGADIMDLDTENIMDLRMRIRQFVEENPQVSAQIIRNWMKGGDEEDAQ